jgi:sigma-B regulation protein RsbU (phosphoserine phosphatase)
MSDVPLSGETVLEVLSPDHSRRTIRITESPFFIGRGGETGKHLQLDDRRISRQCAAITFDGGSYYLEDLGQRRGIFVNGQKTDRRALEDGDVITFGVGDSYEIIFRSPGGDTAISSILTRLGSASGADATPSGLRKLSLLLEATMLLHSRHPADTVLNTMLDHAIAITKADRAHLLEPDSLGSLRVRLARRSGRVRLPPQSLAPSRTALRMALEQQSSVVTEDLAQADHSLQAAQSIVAQELRAVVAIPLYTLPRAKSTESAIHSKQGELLGVLYLDSRRPAAFSKLERQILDALALEAGAVLENARLVERERERQRMEQELNIARDIQQALLPRGLRDFPHLAIEGINFPCLTVGGDYFDVFPMGDDRTSFVIADVSGKGIGAALLTTMLQGAFSGMTVGSDPARVFQHINHFLCEHTEVGRFATMFFGTLDSSGQLEFINAGHPSPLLLRRGTVTTPFTEGSLPVGLIPEATYATTRVTLQSGDTLVLFSDGVSEAMNPEDQMFGVSRLCELLCEQQDAPLDRLQKNVMESVENFARGARQADDITLLLVRYRAAAQTAAP